MMNRDQADKLWTLIKDIEVGMLTSRSGNRLHARPMHLVQKDFDGTLWFFTKKESEKSREADENQQVCVTFADHKAETYVCLSGPSDLVKDQKRIDQWWNPFVAAWFPEGKDDPNVVLMRIEIESAEYWDSTSSRMVQMFEMLRANITKKPPSLGEHGRVN